MLGSNQWLLTISKPLPQKWGFLWWCCPSVCLSVSFCLSLRLFVHWPVRQRIQYRLCTLVSKCLRCTAPSYLADMCIPISSTASCQYLSSAARHGLSIPLSRLAGYGSRSFATSGPSLWNLLPLTIRDSTLTFTRFCSRLKTELCKRTYAGHTAPSW